MNDITAVERFSVSVLPEWLYTYLVKRGLGAESLLEDLSIDERISTDDLATVIHLNSGFLDHSLGNLMLSTYQLTSELLKRRTRGSEAIDAKIDAAMKLSFSNRLKQEVLDLLSVSCDDASLSYSFVVTGPKIWLIVKPGFMSCFLSKPARLSFYRDYLSTVGKVAAIGSVHQTSVFKQYVRDLAA